MKKFRTQNQGFTIVEMLVIVPIVLLTIGAFITIIINMTADVLVTRSANVLAYDIQETLDRIETDVKFSTGFLATNDITLQSPQGYGGGTTAFTNVGANGNMLILKTLATTDNPFAVSNSFVYLDDNPNDCASSQYTNNIPMTTNVIYFVANNTLWRRSVLTSNYTTAGCDTPWQQPSCTPGDSGTPCVAQDVKLLDGINSTDFIMQYFTSASGTEANSIATNTGSSNSARDSALDTTTTVSISINATRSVAGKDVAQSGTIRATRIDINRL